MLDQIPPDVVRLRANLPRLADGRIDFSDSVEAVVVDCYVICEGALLVLKRTNPIAGSLMAWHVVSGYLDSESTLRQKATEELFEETGLTQVSSMKAAEPYVHVDSRNWIVYPVAVRIPKASDIRLNEEHTEYAWINPCHIDNYLLPQVYAAFKRLKI